MNACRELQDLPGIGPAIAADLHDIGIRRPEDLVGRDPEALYGALCQARGETLDRCVLYAFRCAVHNAAGGPAGADPEARKWWNWTDDRLAATHAFMEGSHG